MHWFRHSFLHPLGFFVLVLVVLACEREPEEVQRAKVIWEHHQGVMVRAVGGEMHTEDEFMEALQFFREITGIRIRVDLTTLGALPTAETSEDLERVQQWYRKNGHRLYYDAEAEAVRVR